MRVFRGQLQTLTDLYVAKFEGMTFASEPDQGWKHGGSGQGSGYSSTFQNGEDKYEGSVCVEFIQADPATDHIYREFTATNGFIVECYFGVHREAAGTDYWNGGLQIDDGGDATDCRIGGTALSGITNGIGFALEVTAGAGGDDDQEMSFKISIARGGVLSHGILERNGISLNLNGTRPALGETFYIGIKIEITPSYVKFYTDEPISGIPSGSWTFRGYYDTAGLSSTCDFARVAMGINVFADAYTLKKFEVGQTGEITNLIRPKTVKASRAMRGGGSFQFDYIDKNVANLATVLGFGLDKIYIADDSLGKVFHSGELTKIVQFKNKYQWRGNELIRSLLEIYCNYNPVYYSGVIDTIEDIGAKIYERAKQDQTSFAGKYITITDSFIKRVLFEAKSGQIKQVDRSTPFVPFDSEKAVLTKIGSYRNLYWKEPSIDLADPYNAGELHGAYELDESPDPENNANYVYECYSHIKQNSVPQSMKLFIDFYAYWFNKNVSASEYPAIFIWDEAGSAWEEILTSEDVYALAVAKGTKNGFKGESTYQNITLSDIYEIELDIDISADPDKYLALSTAVNAQGFEYYKILIALDWGTQGYETPDELLGGNDTYKFAYVKYLRIQMDVDLDQNAFYATGKITSNDQTTLTLDTTFNSSISISEDGAMPGDIYNITDLSTDVLDTVWSINSLVDDFILDADNVTLIAEDQDLTDVPVFTFLEKIANQKKWEFWQFTDEDFKDVVKLKDPANFEHTGITITEADIIDYNKEGFSIEHGFHLMRDKIIVKGSFGVRFSHDITPDEATKKSEIITDPSVKSSAQAKNRAENLANKHTSKQIITTIRLDYKKDSSRYSELDAGKLIDLVIKGGTQANFIDSTNTALLILEANIQQQGQFMEFSILVTNSHW